MHPPSVPPTAEWHGRSAARILEALSCSPGAVRSIATSSSGPISRPHECGTRNDPPNRTISSHLMFLPMRMYLLLFGLFLLAAVACNSSTAPSSPDPCAPSGAAATVSATDNFAFTPSSVTITVGESVCWQNTGRQIHTVTENVASRFNGNLPGGQTFVHTFGFGGSFTYRCNNHSNMTGTVVVNCKPGDLVC